MQMVRLSLICALTASSAFAQETTVDCDAFYQQITKDKPMNLDSCTVLVQPYTLKECPKPTSLIGTAPSSHMILAIDASGSMAGRVGGETKMKAAKREALAFLADIPKEVKVGLVVYGHRGSNQDEGKVESCASAEMVHSFESNRPDLQNSIRSLSPIGWTPLGGMLDYTADIVADLPTPKEGDLAPVVYVISDGKETCDGDPVAAAKKLYEAGTRTVVNTIGFAVDAKTAAQLQAIADAAGGTYYPANDVNALRNQLNAIKGAEAELARYKKCVDTNIGAIASVYHNARIGLAGCYQRNNPLFRQSAVINSANRAKRDGTPEASCAREVTDRVTAEIKPYRHWLKDRTDPITFKPLELIEAYRDSTRLSPKTSD